MAGRCQGIFQNVIIRHEQGALVFIQELIQKFDPELFIEIGTKYGGFSYLVYKTCPNVEIHTYDIDDIVNKKLFNEKFHFYNTDSFNESSVINITKLCQDPRRKLLYCDGGSKTKEFLTFGPYLNKGDILGCHDWPAEINLHTVGHYVKNLLPIDNSIFEDMAWGSRFYQIL